jgi:type II secretory pathway pseudopilin PulG
MRSRASREDGFTLIEALVAALVLMLGAFATFGALSTATRNEQRAQSSQVALNRAQQEIERLRSLQYEEVALTAVPAHSSKPLDPNYRVSGNNFAITRRPPSGYAQLVANGGSLYGGGFVEKGAVNPGPTAFTSGSISGQIFRYVVWRNDASCPESRCPGSQDYKQVIVAVKLDVAAAVPGERGYVEVQSNFIDPKDSALKDPKPGSEGVVTAQQLFLSDTPCSSLEREEIFSDHLLHNTLGTCLNGPGAGSTPGAPDLLMLGPPPDPAPEDLSVPAEFDYSSDYPGQLTAETAKGIQLRKQDSSGCNYIPSGTESQWKAHRWVTAPIPATLPEGFRMNGKVTLKFFTRALNDASYTGKLCVYLFLRHETASETKDTLLTVKTAPSQTYWTLLKSPWPKGAWAEEKFEMNFNGPVKVPIGDRLGLAISLERAITSGDAIGFLYDHPKWATRIEVDTTTPIGG